MLTVIISSVIAFTVVILLLVLLLLFAQSKLVQSGDVNIVMNGDEENPLVTGAGSTLLSTLSNQKIFLPSACGGGGTCGLCVVSLDPSAPISTADRRLIPAARLQDGVRLSWPHSRKVVAKKSQIDCLCAARRSRYKN